MSELLVYRRFNDLALAHNLVDILAEHGVQYLLEESPLIFNPTLAVRNEASTEYVIKMDGADFARANQILADYESKFTDDVEPDHYLFDFTDDELMDIVAKPDEWSAFDLALAKKLLSEKGIVIDEAVEKQLENERLAELKEPEKSETLWIVLGYFCALLGGVFGFFLGWHLWKAKKILPNGEQVFAYSNNDRLKGRQIFYLSFIGIFFLIIRNFHYMNN